jgi:hypothetical protein
MSFTNFSLPSGVTSQFNITPKKPKKDRNEKADEQFKGIRNKDAKDTFGAAKKNFFEGELNEAEKDPTKLMDFAEKHLKEEGGKGKIDRKLDKNEVTKLLGEKEASKFEDIWNASDHKYKNSKGDHLIDAKGFFKLYKDLNG